MMASTSALWKMVMLITKQLWIWRCQFSGWGEAFKGWCRCPRVCVSHPGPGPILMAIYVAFRTVQCDEASPLSVSTCTARSTPVPLEVFY